MGLNITVHMTMAAASIWMHACRQAANLTRGMQVRTRPAARRSFWSACVKGMCAFVLMLARSLACACARIHIKQARCSFVARNQHREDARRRCS